jgi:2-polyprenyl-3-methyl-5-hydroxy-6-metoxy-1,4-benzoquinol methylase
MNDLLRINKFGFNQLKDKPTQEALQEWYAKTYYQTTPDTGYEQVYSPEEKQFINNKIEQKFLVLQSILPLSSSKKLRLLDVGCGEGWGLQYFANKGLDVSGLDYSEFGCRHQNPECLQYMTIGDICQNIKALAERCEQYDYIWLDNVLEHVLDPLDILIDLNKLLSSRGVLMIEVPNDCSAVQNHLLENKFISKSFWVAPFEHISYFNKTGLLSISSEAGLVCKDLMGDYPIDLSLFNKLTNFVEQKSTGKDCHQQRIAIENFLHDISPEKTNALYRSMANMGLGRQIIGFFQKK